MKGTTGFALRILIGHVVNHVMRMRFGLAAVDECYRFVARHGPDFAWLS